MSRIYLFLALVLVSTGLGACSSGTDRLTASEEEAKVYKPVIGESRR